MNTENNISDAFEDALDELSDKSLEALRTAFASGPINNPNTLIRWMHRSVLDQVRYRAGDGME